MQNNEQTIREAMRLAQTESGQKLIAMLRQQGGNDLEQALASAAAGNIAQAKMVLGSFLQSEEAQKLLKEMQG